MAGAVTAVGAASGARAYLGARRFRWLGPRRLRLLTIALAVAAVAASATLLGGMGTAPKPPSEQSPSAQGKTPAQP